MNVGEGFSPTYMFFTNMHFSPTSFTNIKIAMVMLWKFNSVELYHTVCMFFLHYEEYPNLIGNQAISSGHYGLFEPRRKFAAPLTQKSTEFP